MRIVAGEWGGRRLRTPKGIVTRPTSDRVREALFSTLLSRFPGRIEGAVVLDAFAGTGALGLEALSRGARHAVFVDSDARALRVLASNVRELGASAATVVSGDVFRLVPGGRLEGGPFSLLFLDPPYRIGQAQVTDLLSNLDEKSVPGHDAVVVYEHDSRRAAVWPRRYVPITEKTYGDTRVSIAVYERGT